MEAGLLD